MQKWSRKKKAHLSLLAAFSSVLVISSFLHDDGIAQLQTSVRRTTRGSSAYASPKQSSETYIFSNSRTHLSTTQILNHSDWSRACASIRSYETVRRRRRESLSFETSDGRSGGVGKESCDLFSGRWIYDDESYPLYDEGGCPYMSDQLACRKHGRPDLDYQKWRWQPHDCDLKRWNATEMLEKLRNKRLMFVGDSLNRGQWISMVCLLQSVIPDGRKSMSPNAALTIFRAEDYNATVEFYWAPLLVESNSDDPVNHRLEHRIIRPDSLIKHTSQWEGADILVFNTYLWWRSGSKIKLLGREEGICQEAEGVEAMQLALETWAEWIDSYVDILKKRIFYVTMSPTHLWSWEWEVETEGNCFQERTPIEREGYWGTGSDIPTMRMVDTVMHKLKSKVSVLNITQLSEYRKDGHPSIYRKFWENLSPQQLSNPASYADCIHWCLPGVPDAWNQLLFHLLWEEDAVLV